jgi:hypothetical protein
MIERFSIDALADALDERLAVSDAELLQRYPGDPKQIGLAAHAVIQLDVGQDVPPRPFAFPSGL